MKKQADAWQDLPIGGVILHPGNAVRYKTGGWRAFYPAVDFEKCTHCLFCWLFCPDVSILVEKEKIECIDLDHCKGCGVCAKVCPSKAICMLPESERLPEANE